MADFVRLEPHGGLSFAGRKSFERAKDAWKAHQAFATLLSDAAAAKNWLEAWFDECEDTLADWRRHEPADGPDPR